VCAFVCICLISRGGNVVRDLSIWHASCAVKKPRVLEHSRYPRAGYTACLFFLSFQSQKIGKYQYNRTYM
jgi:hypothetical protein